MPRRLSVTLAAIALVSGSLLTGGSLQAPQVEATSTAKPADGCLGADHDRVRPGYQGVDPNSLSSASERSAQRAAEKRMASARARSKATSTYGQVTVDVHVHVITKRDGTGAVTRSQINRQLAVLDKAYAGKSHPGSARTAFRFRLRSVDVTRNDNWYSWADPDVDPSDNDDAKAALRRGGFDDLNVYVASLEEGLLGYATFPWDGNRTDDGVVVLNETLPGGAAEPFNQGDTLTHEVGHWLGLLHTFQDGCDAPGDRVGDTPYQDDGDNIFSCDSTLDTCAQPGRDPVHNFMSYGDDPCLDRFTRGQSIRMTLAWLVFRRPWLLP